MTKTCWQTWQKKVSKYIHLFSISAPNAIFHIDQIDLLSRCHCSNFFINVRERREGERERHGRSMNEFLPMMLYWAEKHFYDDELGFIERETKLAYHHHHNVYIHTAQFFIFFIHFVSSWNWMMREWKNYQQTCSRAVKKVHAH